MQKIKKNKNLLLSVIAILVIICSIVIYQVSIVSAQQAQFSSLSTDLKILGNTVLGDVSDLYNYTLTVVGKSKFTNNIGIKIDPDDENPLKVLGNSYLDGNVGINIVPHSSRALYVSGKSEFINDVVIKGSGIKFAIESSEANNLGQVDIENANVDVKNGNIEVIGIGKQIKAPWVCIGTVCQSDWPGGGDVSGSGTSGRVPRWNGAKSLTNGTIRDNGTRIGVGVGVNAAYMLIVNGPVGAPEFIYESDIRLKNNIKTLNNALGKITSLRGVSFNWKEDGKPSLGLIAQEVENIYPELVVEGDDGIKSVKYGNLVAPLIEAIKEQQEQIESLELRIKQLENKK